MEVRHKQAEESIKNEVVTVCDSHGFLGREEKTSQVDKFSVSTRTFMDSFVLGCDFSQTC